MEKLSIGDCVFLKNGVKVQPLYGILDPNIWELEGSCYVMREEIAVEYRKACDVKLDLWLKGVSVHTKPPEGVEDECCPDFSCCYPELLLTLAERQAYVQKRRSKIH